MSVKRASLLAALGAVSLLVASTLGTTAATAAPLEDVPTPAVSIAGDGMVQPMSGFATSPVGTFQYSYGGVTINVPTGCFLNMSVFGTGLHLDSTEANVDCIGPAAIVPLFCNWRGVYKFYNASNVLYASQTKPLHTGCGLASYPIEDATPRTMQTGSICLEFLVGGVKRATTCMAVFP